MAGYLMAWGIFTGLMFIGTLRINRSLQTVFLSLTVLFVLLAVGELDRQRHDHQDRRLGGHLRGPQRRVRLDRPGVERALRQGRPAARPVQEVVRAHDHVAVTHAEGRRHRRVTAPLCVRAPPARQPARVLPSGAVRIIRLDTNTGSLYARTNMCSPQEEERWKVSRRDRSRYWSSSARACAPTAIRRRCARSARASSVLAVHRPCAPRQPRAPRAHQARPHQAARAGRRRRPAAAAPLPLVGRVAAGAPILAEDNVEELVDVRGFLRRDDGDFVLRVRGDSMIGVGIFDARPHRRAPGPDSLDGEIVVARVGEEEATTKRMYRDGATSASSPRTTTTSR